MNEKQLVEEAKRLIDQYFRREFEHGAEPKDFENLSRIGIAYTTTEEEVIPIQAYCDLVNFRIYTCLDVEEVIIREEKYASLQEMIDVALPYLDFVDLTAVDEADMQKLSETLSDAYKRAESDTQPGREKDGPELE